MVKEWQIANRRRWAEKLVDDVGELLGVDTGVYHTSSVESAVELAVKFLDGPPMWTHEEALVLIRKLEPLLAHAGFHVGLGGSVLHRGESWKDLDIIVFPHDASLALEPYEALVEAGLTRKRTADEVRRLWQKGGENTDTKSVEVWWCDATKRRIDVLLLK